MDKSTVIILVIFCTFFENNLGDDESDLFQSNDLDCWYKPSCNLRPSSNASLIPFVAGCKCDVDCSRYNDCCKDSKYFGQSRVRSGKEFTCHPKLEVQMVTSCPESYHNAGVARNCSFEVPIKDISFLVPVTNKKTRTTYANKYCASCHNETDYEPWDLSVNFVEITSDFFEDEDAGRVDRSFEDDLEVAEEENRTTRRIHAEDLFRAVRFDGGHESFVANSEGKKFVCAFGSKMPAEMAAFVRRCLSNLVSECPDDDVNNEMCQSYMEIVYDRYNSLSFRNKDCAECNSVPAEDASYCPQADTSPEPAHGFVISSRNKARNRQLCANPILPRYFCPAKSK